MAMMTTPMMCLLLFALWAIVLVSCVGGYRISQVVQGKVGPAGFPADTPHGPDMYRRLMRAHANCVENLPIFAVLVWVGAQVGLHEGAFATACMVVMVGRIAQSISHIASGRSRVVRVRFACFLVQMLSMLAMAAMIFQARA
jgi:uncharacterized MAPEG superfamily protein